MVISGLTIIHGHSTTMVHLLVKSVTAQSFRFRTSNSFSERRKSLQKQTHCPQPAVGRNRDEGRIYARRGSNSEACLSGLEIREHDLPMLIVMFLL